MTNKWSEKKQKRYEILRNRQIQASRDRFDWIVGGIIIFVFFSLFLAIVL
jgi:hypothetical protein